MQDNAGGNLTTEPVLSTFSMKQFQEMITIEFLNNCINSARIGLTGPTWCVRVSQCLSERMHVSSSIDTTWHPHRPTHGELIAGAEQCLLRALILPIFYMTHNTPRWFCLLPSYIFLFLPETGAGLLMSPMLPQNFINWTTSLTQMGFDIYQQYYQQFGWLVSLNLKISIFKSIEKSNLSKCLHKKVIRS